MIIKIHASSFVHVLQFLKKRRCVDVQLVFSHDSFLVKTIGTDVLTTTHIKKFVYIERESPYDEFEYEISLLTLLKILIPYQDEFFEFRTHEYSVSINNYKIRVQDFERYPMIPTIEYPIHIRLEYAFLKTLIQQISLFKNDAVNVSIRDGKAHIEIDNIDIQYSNILCEDLPSEHEYSISLFFHDIAPLLKLKKQVIHLNIGHDVPIYFHVENDDYRLDYYLRTPTSDSVDGDKSQYSN